MRNFWMLVKLCGQHSNVGKYGGLVYTCTCLLQWAYTFMKECSIGILMQREVHLSHRYIFPIMYITYLSTSLWCMCMPGLWICLFSKISIDFPTNMKCHVIILMSKYLYLHGYWSKSINAIQFFWLLPFSWHLRLQLS